jgi:hypothetical protein
VAANRLTAAGYEVRWARQPFERVGRSWPAGTMVIDAHGARQAQARAVAQALALPLTAIGTPLDGSGAPAVRPLRLALYNPWGGNIDEGWARLLLERNEFHFTEIRNGEIADGSLASRFEAVLFGDQQPASLLDGFSPSAVEPQYAGGLGEQGVDQLRAFVARGGELIALGAATDFFIQQFELPVRNVLEGLASDVFFCPGSILRARVDASHRLGYGMPDETSIFFARGSAFDVDPARASHVRTIVRYAADHVLQSGWMVGEDRLRGRAAAVEVAYGRGHVVLFGFRVQHRAQPHATFKLLFNALYAPR